MNVDAWQKVEEVNGWFNDEYFTIIIIQMSNKQVILVINFNKVFWISIKRADFNFS